MPSVLQEWVEKLTMMQQSVLITAIRGPDGSPKYGPVKMLQRWFRRCVLKSAIDGKALINPYDSNGGSFTGPSIDREVLSDSLTSWTWEVPMNVLVGEYLKTLDALPHHFQLHFLHAAEIIGYKHEDERIRVWWCGVYNRLVHDMHLHAENEAEMDQRLGDNRAGWLARSDPATSH